MATATTIDDFLRDKANSNVVGKVLELIKESKIYQALFNLSLDNNYSKYKGTETKTPISSQIKTATHNLGATLYLDIQKSLQTVADYITKIPGKIKDIIQKIYDTPKGIINRIARYTSAIPLAGTIPRGVRSNYGRDGYRSSKEDEQ